jgi:cytochrome c-type protein NapB
MSHPQYSNCTQCHVPADGLRSLTEDERLFVANSFEGLGAPGRGSRAYPGAPPTVPHGVFMRQNCMSCHGPDRPNAILSSHPERQNCLQCHAPDATLDNRERLMGGAPPPAP